MLLQYAVVAFGEVRREREPCSAVERRDGRDRGEGGREGGGPGAAVLFPTVLCRGSRHDDAMMATTGEDDETTLIPPLPSPPFQTVWIPFKLLFFRTLHGVLTVPMDDPATLAAALVHLLAYLLLVVVIPARSPHLQGTSKVRPWRGVEGEIDGSDEGASPLLNQCLLAPHPCFGMGRGACGLDWAGLGVDAIPSPSISAVLIHALLSLPSFIPSTNRRTNASINQSIRCGSSP